MIRRVSSLHEDCPLSDIGVCGELLVVSLVGKNYPSDCHESFFAAVVCHEYLGTLSPSANAAAR
jgi:hypothetical protein